MTRKEEYILPKAISETFLVHFNLPDHEIPLSTFIETANGTQAVIQAFNDILFEGKPQFEIYVIPPEEGTFLSKLKLIIIAGVIKFNWEFLESDIGKKFFRNLTTKEPADYAGEIATSIRDNFSSKTEHDKNIENKIECQTGAEILIEASRSFLQKDNSNLQEMEITPNLYPEAFGAKNRFYEACENTPNLNSIGFENDPIFPIDRNRFSSMQIAMPKKEEEEEDEIEWAVEETTLKVTSPNWDKKDKKRQWKGKDSDGNNRLFRIEDEGFWSLVSDKKISPNIIDTILVQWAFHGKNTSPKNARVLKVLEFNDKVLSEPLEKNALDSILGKHLQKPDSHGVDLFNSNPYTPETNMER